MFDLATSITATKTSKIDLPGVAESQEIETVYLNNVSRRVVSMPNYKDMRVRSGQQANEKAEYLIYLTPIDPWLPQLTRIVWTFRGKEFSGEVKFTKSKGAVNLGYDKECYIISDNE
jgi:hypothetical protein